MDISSPTDNSSEDVYETAMVNLNETLPLEHGDENDREPSWFVVSIRHKPTANSVKHFWGEGAPRAQEKLVDKLLSEVDKVGSMSGIKESISTFSRYDSIVCKIVRKHLPHLHKSPYLEVVLMSQNGSSTKKDIWWISPKYPVHVPVLCKAMPGDILLFYGAAKVEKCKAIVLDWTQTFKDVIVVHCSLMGMEEDDCTKDQRILATFCNTKCSINRECTVSRDGSLDLSVFYPKRDEESTLENESVDDDVENACFNMDIRSPVACHENSVINPPSEKPATHNRNESSANLDTNKATVSLHPRARQDVDDSLDSFHDGNESSPDENPSSSNSFSPIDYDQLYEKGEFLPASERPKPVKLNLKKTAQYTYRTLLELDSEIQKSVRAERKNGRLPAMCLKTQQFVYGFVIATCPPNRREFNAYHVRISDETMSNVLLRIHGNQTYQELGPKIEIGNVIRVHRVTAQVEFDSVFDSRRLVLSTTPHLNYTLFSLDETSKSIIYNTCAQTLTVSDHDRRRAVSLLKYFSKKDQHVQQNTRTGSQQSHLPENSHHVEDNDNVEPGNEDEVGLNTVTRDSDVYSPPTDTFNQIFEQEVEQRGSSAHKHKEDLNALNDKTSEEFQNSEEPHVDITNRSSLNSQSQGLDTHEANLNKLNALVEGGGDTSSQKSGAGIASGSIMGDGLESQVLSFNDARMAVMAVNSQSQRIESQTIDYDDLLDELGESEELDVDMKSFISPTKHTTAYDQPPRKSPRFHKTPPPSPV